MFFLVIWELLSSSCWSFFPALLKKTLFITTCIEKHCTRPFSYAQKTLAHYNLHWKTLHPAFKSPMDKVANPLKLFFSLLRKHFITTCIEKHCTRPLNHRQIESPIIHCSRLVVCDMSIIWTWQLHSGPCIESVAGLATAWSRIKFTDWMAQKESTQPLN